MRIETLIRKLNSLNCREDLDVQSLDDGLIVYQVDLAQDDAAISFSIKDFE